MPGGMAIVENDHDIWIAYIYLLDLAESLAVAGPDINIVNDMLRVALTTTTVFDKSGSTTYWPKLEVDFTSTTVFWGSLLLFNGVLISRSGVFVAIFSRN